MMLMNVMMGMLLFLYMVSWMLLMYGLFVCVLLVCYMVLVFLMISWNIWLVIFLVVGGCVLIWFRC